MGSQNCLIVIKCVGIDVNHISMGVCSSMMLGKTTLMPTRLAMIAADANIDVLGVSCPREVPWLLQCSVENHHSSRPIGESIK